MTKHVHIRQAERTLAVPADQTILEAALADGIAYPHGCRSGRCGACKSRLVSGTVDLLDHSRFALSEGEKAEGLILACRAIPTTDAVVAWLGGDEEVVSHPRRRLNCRVTAVDDATHDIKRIRLAIEGAAPLAFTPGQYARLTFPGSPARDYSMASQPEAPELEFHIRRVPGGAATDRIHARLQRGDMVSLEGPFGSSYLREQHAGPILCVAGGSGLAPINGIVEAAIARGMQQPIHVYFGARGERDLYLVDHFERLAQRHLNLIFTAVLSEPPSATRWRTGFVTDAVAADLLDLDGWKVYLAGPPAMADAAMRIVVERGVRPGDVHADVFFTPEETSVRSSGSFY
jgi:CDP-4-dehydro-6-deoxyglucose reductase/ferredoxin-NAD(P)+ reductase (naphthalene dioxygenase ferredoxin-specific)